MKERHDNYTLTWVLEDGRKMSCTVNAVSKEHALSKAMGDSLKNMFIIDYLSQFDHFDTTNFLWSINGKIS